MKVLASGCPCVQCLRMRRWLCWNYGGEDEEELRDEDEEGKGKGCTKFWGRCCVLL